MEGIGPLSSQQNRGHIHTLFVTTELKEAEIQIIVHEDGKFEMPKTDVSAF